MMAAMKGHDKCTSALVEAGADVNAADDKGYTAVMKTAYSGHDKCAAILIRAGADVNATDGKGFTALMGSVCSGQGQCAAILIRAEADVNVSTITCGRTALHFASNEKCVERLIEAGADVNGVDNDGRSPLMLAASSDHRNIANLLIETGADVNAVDHKGYTALHDIAFRRE